MTSLQVINYIASNPHFETVVINDSDDRMPIQAIECLSCDNFQNDWRINSTLEKNVLLVYDAR